MKKLLLITILLFGIHSYAQKRLAVFNNSSFSVLIVDITTSASGAYPEFSADLGSIGPITLAPGGFYILENNSIPVNMIRFPFQSPTSSPPITTWNRRTSPTMITPLPSGTAWVLGNAQVFDRLSFRILAPSTGFGTIGPSNPSIIGGTWSATYSVLAPTTYTVVFN